MKKMKKKNKGKKKKMMMIPIPINELESEDNFCIWQYSICIALHQESMLLAARKENLWPLKR